MNFVVKYLMLIALFATCFGVGKLHSVELRGTKIVYLVRVDKSELKLGTITFSQHESGTSASVTLESEKFVDHFLSMRPFRCITEKAQSVCHLPYPYKLKNRVAPNDLRYLEYQLLFIHRTPSEYGINFWNGMYYRLNKQADGSIRGTLMETDFNELASPPDKEFSYPFDYSDLTEAVPDQYQFPEIIIR